MSRITGRTFAVIMFLLISCSVSHANMKKAKVPNEGFKAYQFETFSDGPCVATIVYDSKSSDLDLGVATLQGDLIAVGASSQKNFEILVPGLPPDSYIVLVDSFRGASVFRLVVNCGSQEELSIAGAGNRSGDLREVELDFNGRKALENLRKAAARMKNP